MKNIESLDAPNNRLEGIFYQNQRTSLRLHYSLDAYAVFPPQEATAMEITDISNINDEE